MNWIHVTRINCATRHCLAECCKCDYPLVYLSDCTDVMRNMGWPETEVLEIKRQVTAELARLRADRARAPRSDRWPGK